MTTITICRNVLLEQKYKTTNHGYTLHDYKMPASNNIHDRLAVCTSVFVQLTAFLVHICIKLDLCSSEWHQIWNVDSWLHALDRNGEFFSKYMHPTCKMIMSYVKIELTSTALAKAKPEVSFIVLKVVPCCICGVTRFLLQALGVGLQIKLPKARLCWRLFH